jgi:hypothetical protein
LPEAGPAGKEGLLAMTVNTNHVAASGPTLQLHVGTTAEARGAWWRRRRARHAAAAWWRTPIGTDRDATSRRGASPG